LKICTEKVGLAELLLLYLWLKKKHFPGKEHTCNNTLTPPQSAHY
jgi:hypothetical protein